MKGRINKLKKMKLNSVDFVRRGANQAADIALYKSADYTPEENYIDVTKADGDLALFTDILSESFSSIMKDDSLSDDERLGMIQKSMYEFTDTVDEYLTSLSIIGKSDNDYPEYMPNIKKGDEAMFNYEDVDKSNLTKEESEILKSLLAKANGKKGSGKVDDFEIEVEDDFDDDDDDEILAGKVNPAKKTDLPPEVKKALQEVETLKKTYEMQQLEEVAKKYEVLGKKANEEAKVLYDLKKSGESNYNAYIAAMNAQIDLIEKSGIFAEIGKSGGYNYSSLAKSDAETKIEAIAKSYIESDPSLSYVDAVTKAWENNPELMDAYEREIRQ